MGYSQMQDAVALAARYDADVLCEEFIDGDEVTCPVLGEGAGARALPVIRIVAPEGNYDYQNKYFTDATQLPSARAACRRPKRPRSSASCWQAYRTLGCRGWGRADLMIARQRPQALPAGDEHLARHDRALAGADVGAGRRHQLRRAVPAAAGAAPRWTHRPPRREAPEPMATRQPTAEPAAGRRAADERRRRRCWSLVCAALAAGAGAVAGWRASRCSRCARIRVEGDLTHNSAVTLRANAAPQLAGNFFTLDLDARARAPSRPCPGCARPWCSAIWPEPPGGAAGGAPAPWRCGAPRRRRPAGQQLRRGVRGQRRRCRGRRPAALAGPDGSVGAGAGDATPRCSRLFEPLDARDRARWSCRAAARWRARARQRRRDRARPRQRRRGAWRARARFVAHA